MSYRQTLLYNVLKLDISLRLGLLDDLNSDLVQEILKHLPIQSVLQHVVVSGEIIWSPTRIVYLGHENMAERRFGSVYLDAPGLAICMCYGQNTSNSNVNKFAEVYEEDLPTLQRLAALTYEQTFAGVQRDIIEVEIRRQSS